MHLFKSIAIALAKFLCFSTHFPLFSITFILMIVKHNIENNLNLFLVQAWPDCYRLYHNWHFSNFRKKNRFFMLANSCFSEQSFSKERSSPYRCGAIDFFKKCYMPGKRGSLFGGPAFSSQTDLFKKLLKCSDWPEKSRPKSYIFFGHENRKW